MANLSCFITDFLQSTEEEEKNIPHGVKRPLEPAVPAEQERADRKSARERRRRAEVGEKFEELTSALAQAEAALPHVLTRPRSDAEGSRVELLQRAIDAIASLVNAARQKRDEETAAGGLLGVAHAPKTVQQDHHSVANARPISLDHHHHPGVSPAPAPADLAPAAAAAAGDAAAEVRIMIVAQTAISRDKLDELARSGSSWYAPVDRGADVASAASSASSACASFVVGKGELPLAAGPPLPAALGVPRPAALTNGHAQAPVAPTNGHAPTQAPTNPPQPPAANHHAAADHLDHRARSPAPFRKHSFDMGLPLHTSNGAGSPAANGATDAAPSYYAPAA